MTQFEKMIERNFQRFESEPYEMPHLFREPTYDWPGDYEGRALLAFDCHYAISGKKVPQFDDFFEAIESHLNEKGYFGPLMEGHLIREQQLAGNSWFLRGLLRHFELFHDDYSSMAAHRLIDNLYQPSLPFYKDYPVDRSESRSGGVYGNVLSSNGSFELSSDVGCLFISLDGLAHYYALFPDQRLLPSLVDAASTFQSLDKSALHLQTHATLSGARGLLTLYEATGEKSFLTDCISSFSLYANEGMSGNYENFNWFGRSDTWTEPCCVVDSLILAIGLYKITHEESYLTLARRILFNGIPFEARPNGGAGPNSCLTKENPILSMAMDEACQCCTMRFAEGLLTYHENKGLFPQKDEEEIHAEGARYFMGDFLLAEDLTGIFKNERHYSFDGKSLIKIPNLLSLTWEEAKKAKLKVIF